jgi:hypothetical protein
LARNIRARADTQVNEHYHTPEGFQEPLDLVALPWLNAIVLKIRLEKTDLLAESHSTTAHRYCPAPHHEVLSENSKLAFRGLEYAEMRGYLPKGFQYCPVLGTVHLHMDRTDAGALVQGIEKMAESSPVPNAAGHPVRSALALWIVFENGPERSIRFKIASVNEAQHPVEHSQVGRKLFRCCNSCSRPRQSHPAAAHQGPIVH